MTVIPLGGIAASIDALIAARLGPKTPPTIPSHPQNRLLSLSDAFQASNAMFETDTFFLFRGGTTGNTYDTASSDNIEYKAWLHDSSNNNINWAYDWYWQLWTGATQPSGGTFYGTLEIDIYKAGGITSWADQCLFVGCLLEWDCINIWEDLDAGTSGRNSATAFTPLVLTKGTNGHFSYSGSMTSAEHARIVAACGNHQVSRGYREVWAELLGVYFFAVFDPIAVTARSLP